MIQAKPLYFKTADEDVAEILEKQNKYLNGDDEYLSAVTKEAFAPDDDQVLMIDPGLDVDEIFSSVKLPCEETPLLNNSINAPSTTTSSVAQTKALYANKKSVQHKPLAQAQKSFKYPSPSTTDNSSKTSSVEEVDTTPAREVNPDALQFSNIMKSLGANNLLATLGDLPASDEDDYDSEEEAKTLDTWRS